jgi:hypothetical protein
VCVCVCVWRERDRDRREGGRPCYPWTRGQGGLQNQSRHFGEETSLLISGFHRDVDENCALLGY